MRESLDRSTGLVGDGYDEERLLNAKEVGRMLGISHKRVYTLPIPQVRISQRCIRYRPRSVEEYIDRRTEAV
jgi:predicted DNA-binding transcriptional regulator AlpA